MNKKLTLSILAAVIALMSIAIAESIPKPSQPSDPFEPSVLLSVYGSSSLPALDITASNSFAGTACTEKYASTGSYCSGHVRVYYQCLPTMDGNEWQQRSENCGDYPGGGICAMEDGQATCKDYAGQTEYGRKMLFMGIGLVVVGALAGFFVHPILFLLIPMGVWILIKLWVGGI